MSTVLPELTAPQPDNVGDNLAGMGSFFIDPPGAARRLPTTWFWIGPLVVFSIVSFISSYLLLPIVQHVMEVMPIPSGIDPDRFQQSMNWSLKIQRAAVYFTPVITAVIYALEALVIYASASVMSLKVTFRQMFNLVAGCSLIQLLSSVAGVLVLKLKGDVSTTAELRPALGLDIFMPEGANRFLTAFLGYFSVFEIWWIVMMVLILSTAFRVSKGKSLAVMSPWILLSLFFRVAAAGLQRT